MQDILDTADVGRTTFYAHFETKEYLLKELCEELFGHIFRTEEGDGGHGVFACDHQDDAFLHLFFHISNNDNNLVKLFSSENTALFLDYFKKGVEDLVEKQAADFSAKKPAHLPDDYWKEYIAATFINTVRWWIARGLKETPQEIFSYFSSVVKG